MTNLQKYTQKAEAHFERNHKYASYSSLALPPTRGWVLTIEKTLGKNPSNPFTIYRYPIKYVVVRTVEAHENRSRMSEIVPVYMMPSSGGMDTLAILWDGGAFIMDARVVWLSPVGLKRTTCGQVKTYHLAG